MAVTHPMAVTDADFAQEIGQHQGLAIVDFWATWCGPCQIIAPVIEQMADEYEGRLKVAKLDVDANQRTAMQYGVRSIPTVLLFKDGKLVDSVVGAVPKALLVEKVERHL
ncbi:MAG TPA: thioredoxin [Gemmatimonadales bacterium]